MKTKSALSIWMDFSFGRIKKPLFILLLIYCVVETALILLMANTMESYMKAYEIILQNAWVILLFFFAVIAFVIIQVVQLGSYFKKQKGIYTILTLPSSPVYFVFANILVGLFCILSLIAVQLVLTFALYPLAESVANSFSLSATAQGFEGSVDFPRQSLNNGLFLAFVRSAFLHFILPYGLEGVLLLVSFFVAWSVLPVCQSLLKFKGIKSAVVPACVLLFALATVYAFLVSTVNITGAITEITLLNSNIIPIVLLLGISGSILFVVLRKLRNCSLLLGGAK